jgi:trimeric autotransporter adhesin
MKIRSIVAALLLSSTAALAMGEEPESLSGSESGEIGGVEVGCNGPIFATARDDSGLIYLGGSFTACANQAFDRIVAYNSETNEFHALVHERHNGVNDTVLDIAVSGKDVYVGGSFTEAGGESASHVARWDGNRWHPLGAGLNDRVEALAVSGDDVYAGGFFSRAGGEPARHVARWDGSQWHPLRGDKGKGVNASVNALAADSGDLYAGGWFTEAGGVRANLVARWDGKKWNSLGEGDENGVDVRLLTAIETLAVGGDEVYVGGQFTNAGSIRASRIARWDGSRWYALGGISQ